MMDRYCPLTIMVGVRQDSCFWSRQLEKMIYGRSECEKEKVHNCSSVLIAKANTTNAKIIHCPKSMINILLCECLDSMFEVLGLD